MRCATNKLRRGLTASALALAAASLAAPLSAKVVPLAELEQQALANRGSVLAERARVRAAGARVDIARAPLYPALGASAEAWAGPGGRLVRVVDVEGTEYRVAGSRTLEDGEAAFTPEPRVSASLALSAQIYDFGRTRAAVSAARSELGAAEAAVSAERLAVVGEVRAAYLAWLGAHGARELARRDLEIATALKRALEGRIAEGTARAADLTAARFDEAGRALELAQIEAQLDAQRRTLERVLSGKLPADAEPDYGVLEESPARAKAGSAPQVRALEAQRNAALETARAHRLAHAPVLAAGADAGIAAQGGELFPVYRVGVSLSMSLLDGGHASASSELATARADELAALARSARNDAALQTAQAEAELATLERQLGLAEQLLALAKQAVLEAEARNEEGQGGFELVSRARLQQTTAERGLFEARVARARARLRLAGPRPR